MVRRSTKQPTSSRSGRARTKSCKDCSSVTRPAPHPGPRCATCHRNRRNSLSLARRLTYVASQYNLSPERYTRLLERFGGLCWICRYRKGRQVDHDHKCCSGKTSCGKCVRGILCGPCNKFLGFIRDRPEVLQNGLIYLTEYQEGSIWHE